MKTSICSIVIMSLLFVSCSDIFEESLEDRKVNLIAPGDSITNPTTTPLFWWDPVDDALKYRLQIVTPDFNNVSTLIMDTLVTDTKISRTLDSGSYQWRVRAENGSTQTQYTTRTVFIDE